MDTREIVTELEAERDRLSEAISALNGTGTGRNIHIVAPTKIGGPARLGRGKRHRRKLSAAARARIGRAMKKLWATRRKAQVKANG